MNDCEETQDNLEAYTLGFLGESERKRCDEHLRSCGTCRGILAEVRDTVRMLEDLPREPSSASDLEARILSLAAEEVPAPSRGWGRLGRAAAVAGWLIAVALGASAMTAAYLGNSVRNHANAGLGTLLEAQERRISSLMEARADDRAVVRDAVAAQLEGPLEGIRSQLESLRDEAGRLADSASRIEPLYEAASTLAKDLEECRDRGTRLERALGELASRLQVSEMASQARDRALRDLTVRVDAREGPQDGLVRSVPPPTPTDPATTGAPEQPIEVVSTAAPLAPRDLGAASTMGPMRAQTPWDAAFRMASAVVRSRGREIPGRIREYQDDLFRIYGAKD